MGFVGITKEGKAMEITAIYDAPEFGDRYTVNFDVVNRNGLNDCLCLSDNPSHPLGICQFGMGKLGDHNGKKIAFSDLPADVQKQVNHRMAFNQ